MVNVAARGETKELHIPILRAGKGMALVINISGTIGRSAHDPPLNDARSKKANMAHLNAFCTVDEHDDTEATDF